MTAQPTCKTCKWWVYIDHDPYTGEKHPPVEQNAYWPSGECRRRCPIFMPSDGRSLQNQWPITGPKDWCGDHEKQIKADDPDHPEKSARISENTQ